jgi:hypothetical protein
LNLKGPSTTPLSLRSHHRVTTRHTTHNGTSQKSLLAFSVFIILYLHKPPPLGPFVQIQRLTPPLRLAPMLGCLYLLLNHTTSAFSLPLNHQCSSSSLQYLVHSHIKFMSSSHNFFNFESKKFMSYSNECNKIILVNYNFEGMEKTTRGGVNESQLKFLK